jgi:hypothetical protein
MPAHLVGAEQVERERPPLSRRRGKGGVEWLGRIPESTEPDADIAASDVLVAQQGQKSSAPGGTSSAPSSVPWACQA